jgi:GNAT superfamily N-acetyltransferase
VRLGPVLVQPKAEPIPDLTAKMGAQSAAPMGAVQLSDGQRVVIRPISPQDRELVVAYFRGLSAGARCSRFRHLASEPSWQLVRELTQVDQANHVAFVAEVPVSRRKIAVGEARYVRAAGSCSAEISISIADRWQGKGLGRSMLAWLEQHAADAGVRRLTGEILAVNERMLCLASSAGFTISDSSSLPGVKRVGKILARA